MAGVSEQDKMKWEQMQNQIAANAPKFKYVSMGKPGEVEKVEDSPEQITTSPIPDEKVVEEWNKFVRWMGEKGVHKNKDIDLNTGGLGYKYFDQYRKETGSPIDREDLPRALNIYNKKMESDYNDLLAGKLYIPANPFDPKSRLITGNTPEAIEGFKKARSFYFENMKSKNPSYPGSFFTRTIIPTVGKSEVVKGLNQWEADPNRTRKTLNELPKGDQNLLNKKP